MEVSFVAAVVHRCEVGYFSSLILWETWGEAAATVFPDSSDCMYLAGAFEDQRHSRFKGIV